MDPPSPDHQAGRLHYYRLVTSPNIPTPERVLTEDILGAGWTAQTLELKPDAEGPVVATLVRREPAEGAPLSHRAVLYLHGYIDYFFQAHLGDAWAANGFNFYALDLRKYGRSLRSHQTPNYVTDLAAYDEEIDEAIRIIRAEGHDCVVLMGHSTGGLIASLWADRHRGDRLIDALILNSPWFDLNGSRFEQTVLTRVVSGIGRISPKTVVAKLPDHYARSIHKDADGEWDFDLTWKPFIGFPVRAGWLRTVRRGHAVLNRGLNIDVPVLVATSSLSGNHRKPSPELTNADCVLNVAHMVKAAPGLGSDVTVVQISGGVHDLVLSAPAVRAAFLAEIFSWTKEHVGSRT